MIADDRASSIPDIVLYGRAGCHLCDFARDAIAIVMSEREAAGLVRPRLVERDIDDDPELRTELRDLIPVVAMGAQRVELVTRVGRIRRLVADALDGTPDAALAGR